MRNSFRKTLCVMLSCILISSALSVSAVEDTSDESPEKSFEIGDKIGKVLSTDIVTYVEGVKIPSFNIKGRTAVVAQDLAKLGSKLNFGVYFDEESRVLTIMDKDIYGWGDKSPMVYYGEDDGLRVGTPVKDVLFTDITVNYEDTPLESFNIDGFTCIYADDLGKLCGSYEWNPESRLVNVRRASTPYVTASKVSSVRKFDAEETAITKNETFDRWSETSGSYLVKNSSGTYTVIDVGEHINIENYDEKFNHNYSYAIAKELPIFGAFYEGKEYNYIAFGQENLLEDNSREVIKIVVYNKNFGKLREISVANCKTAIPFDASGCDIYENDRYLILHTSRSQYLDENNSRPQTQLTVIVDKTTWTVTNMLGKFQYNHMSHALCEFVKIDGDKIVTANYSDAAPIRGAFIQELDFYGKVTRTKGIFNVSGPLGANCTGAMIGGLEVSDKGYLVPISSIDHSLPTDYTNVGIEGIDEEHRNVYLLWTDKAEGELRHTCLAGYSGTSYTASVPYIAKLKNDMFLVMWQKFDGSGEESSTVGYAFVDGEGKQVGVTSFVKGVLSEDCRPFVSGDRVYWYVNTEDGRDFYSLHAYLPKKADNPPAEEPSDEEIAGETDKSENEDDKETEDNKNQNISTEVDGI